MKDRQKYCIRCSELFSYRDPSASYCPKCRRLLCDPGPVRKKEEIPRYGPSFGKAYETSRGRKW